jgi:uncharacterized protein
MDPRLTSLLGLQEALRVQRDLELEFNEIPARKQEIHGILSKLEEEVMKAKEDYTTHELEHKSRELELKETQESRVKKEAQTLSIKNTKEHEAILHEIESLDSKSARLEERILALLDHVEKDQKNLDAKKAELEKKRDSFKTEVERLDQAEKELVGEVERARAATEALIPTINPALYRRFKTIFENKGLALTTANGGHCGACSIRLTPRTIQLAKRGQDIVTCEGCSRFLYWDEALEEDNLDIL